MASEASSVPEDEAVQLLTPDWPAPASVRAYCTTRTGGTSVAPYDSLNLALHVGDEPESVTCNRQRLGQFLNWPAEPRWLDQRHGCNIIRNDDAGATSIADASWTSRRANVCVVMTADCLPLLLARSDGSKIAAVHAGWRGLAAGIIEASVAALATSGNELQAWLGPAIGPEVYEIDTSVRTAMLAADPGGAGAFEPTRPGHWNMDLYYLARRRLRKAGMNAIYGGNFCTYSEPERFFSYRRDGACGRMATMIWREP